MQVQQKEVYSRNTSEHFLFTFCIEQKCITGKKEFRFVYLTKTVLKTKKNVIFYINNADLDDPN